jgi:glycerol-3-phosphate acyltransferase PlsY
MVAAGAMPLLVLWAARAGTIGPSELLPLLWFGVVCALFVIWTHRSNIARMRAGTEPRAKRLWLLGRFTKRS